VHAQRGDVKAQPGAALSPVVRTAMMAAVEKRLDEMSAEPSDKRSRVIKAAVDLSYAHGLGKVSLADISEKAEVSLGNLYYYFKTKDAIGEAVIAQRSAEFEWMRAQWDLEPTPQGRLKAFVAMTAGNRENLVRGGCPVGSLCAELGKQEGPLAGLSAEPLRRLLSWTEDQFAAMGLDEAKDALALHLLAVLQGISLLANAFRDPAVVQREAVFLNCWIDTLDPSQG
jgi:AcrR family transcriptional regulator